VSVLLLSELPYQDRFSAIFTDIQKFKKGGDLVALGRTGRITTGQGREHYHCGVKLSVFNHRTL